MQNELRSRVITSLAIGVPAFVVVVIGGSLFVAIAALLAMVACFECSSVVYRKDPVGISISLLSALIALFGCFVWGEAGYIAFFPLSVLAILGLTIFRFRLGGPTVEGLLTPLISIIYAVFLPTLAVVVALSTGGGKPVLWLVLSVIACDSFSYFGGKRFGGPKLAPGISPNKTVSGLVTGSLCCFVFALVLGATGLVQLSASALVLLSALVAILAQLGDLGGSTVKRLYGVKDFASLLPGHGGVYDRLVAHFFALPVLLLVRLIG